jgi:hypothetical protein
MNTIVRGLVGLSALILSASAAAQTVLLDDSLSPRRNYAVDLNWQPEEIGRALSALFTDNDAALPPLTGFVPNVEVTLSTAEHMGQRVRIYLSMPAVIIGDNTGGDLNLRWQARGTFESGSIGPGQRALIFEGAVDSPTIGGTFDFTLSMSSDSDLDSLYFEPVYELEVIN